MILKGGGKGGESTTTIFSYRLKFLPQIFRLSTTTNTSEGKISERKQSQPGCTEYMQLPASKIRFELLNSLSEKEVKESKFVVYAHECTKGLYIGYTSDPVKRWQEHFAEAMNENGSYYDDAFREAIRFSQHGMKHYILAVANFEKSAKSKEAAAIAFYRPSLNMRIEPNRGDLDHDFRPIQGQLGLNVILDKKPSEKTSIGRQDRDRKTVTAEIIMEQGRKRLVSLAGPEFPAGLRVECARSEREKFNVGDRVKVNVALSEKPNGRSYLVAAKTSKLTPA